MQKFLGLLAGLSLLGVVGCSGINLGLAGTAGDVTLGANADPINKTVSGNASATKAIHAGGVDTTVNTSTDGGTLNVDTQVQKDEE